MFFVSHGVGRNCPQGERWEVSGLAELIERINALEPREEEWWSGYLWKGDFRRKANFEAAGLIMVDMDFENADRQHDFVPEPLRARVNLVEVPGDIVYHTPRGMRSAVLLPELVTDGKIAEDLTYGLGRAVRDHLEARGIFGYKFDLASKVTAQLFFLPKAKVDNKQRDYVAVRGVPVTVGELARLGAIEIGEYGRHLPEADIASALETREAEGQNDGSMELIFCAKYAMSLGVKDASEFVEVAQRWNKRRAEPWTDEELAQRFADAFKQWEKDGKARVPTGKYRRASLDTILHFDRLYAGRLSYDEIEDSILYDKETLAEEGITKIEVEICSRYGFAGVPRQALYESMVMHAKRRPYNRVQDYLNGLPEWDRQRRDEALVEALHVKEEHRELAAVYLRKMRMAAVARAFVPGIKFDNVLVLVGEEGLGKSRFFRALAGDDNFSDTNIDVMSKDGYMQLSRAWITEWSELEAVTRRADVARVKAFLSSAVDQYRPPYGRSVIKVYRRGLCVGTSNSGDIIVDADSNRRFWVNEIEGKIDVDWVLENRDQLWREAVEAYLSGEPLWLDEDEETLRRLVNGDYEPDRPVVDRLPEVLELVLASENRGNWFKPKELFFRLGLDQNGGGNPAVFGLITSHLKRLGFERQFLRLGDARTRIYLKRGSEVSKEAREKEKIAMKIHEKRDNILPFRAPAQPPGTTAQGKSSPVPDENDNDDADLE